MRPLARALDVLVLLTPPSLEGTDALAIRLAALEELRERSVLVTTGDGPYRPEECASALSLPLGGHLPRDDAAASMIWRSLGVEGIRRRPLGRAVADLASVLGLAPTDPKVGDPRESERPIADVEALLTSDALDATAMDGVGR